MAADRSDKICQAQSVNLFLPADVHKRDLHQLHFQAWKRGVKSLYYCRSLSIQRAERSDSETPTDQDAAKTVAVSTVDYEECASCQ